MQNETIANMFNDLGIDPGHESINLQKLAAVDSRFLRDTKLNVSAVLGSSNMNRKETTLLAMATAVNEKNDVLTKAFEQLAIKEGASDAEIAEVHACTAIMATNNIFYRFRHYMHDVEYYNNTPAGLRASVMMNPVLGKEFFELMSLVVSALNGCERCVTSHEGSVKQHGASEPRIYDAIRLGSVIKSLCVIV
ncbi:carboxymuconolactone decarboxylase family protein [Polluticoccus soli]|uniref:carboxymuconolactone decarboxylase family protein n=1 Tax=Polluticoccus soli TaxID=3034150 RepID=UPI0023E0F7C2|nr:carboxymuconolactone decarboxylase family protein [Flavipsychrobacter sp. JY13-12]